MISYIGVCSKPAYPIHYKKASSRQDVQASLTSGLQYQNKRMGGSQSPIMGGTCNTPTSPIVSLVCRILSGLAHTADLTGNLHMIPTFQPLKQ